MAKQLLIDYTLFEIRPEMITESENANNGRLIVTGVLQRSDAKNQNGRIYPKEILEREVEKYKKREVAEKRALGELDHPESSVVNLKNVRRIAATEVNRISVGQITHSAPGINFKLEI